MISMNLIRRVLAPTAAAAMAALVTVTSACGGAATSTAAPTNGLEKKSPADVLQAAAAALEAAKSVRFVGMAPNGHIDVRIQPGSATGTISQAGQQLRFTIVGGAGYINIDQAGPMMSGLSPSVQRQAAGRWLKVPASDFTGLTLASLASQLTAYHGPLEPKVRQATLGGMKVVVVSWRDGGKLYVANTGPAYPLRADFKKGPDAGLIEFTEYRIPLHITAPSTATNSTTGGSSPMFGTGSLRAKIVPAPSGWALAQGFAVHNGPMSAAGFNRWNSTSNLAVQLHYIRGYDVTYYSNTSSDSIEVTVFQFATREDATAFKRDFVPAGPVNSRADAVIPGASDYDSTSAYQGTYDHGVIATKGTLAFVIDDATGSAAKVPLVAKLARQQYAAL
jgi:hypothetical protein